MARDRRQPSAVASAACAAPVAPCAALRDTTWRRDGVATSEPRTFELDSLSLVRDSVWLMTDFIEYARWPIGEAA